MTQATTAGEPITHDEAMGLKVGERLTLKRYGPPVYAKVRPTRLVEVTNPSRRVDNLPNGRTAVVVYVSHVVYVGTPHEAYRGGTAVILSSDGRFDDELRRVAK